MVGGEDDYRVVGNAAFLDRCHHPAEAGIEQCHVAVVLGHRLLPPRPVLVLQVPLPVLAQVAGRLAGERLVEVGPRRYGGRVVPRRERFRDDVGEVRSGAVDAQEERLGARRPLTDEIDALVGAAPRIRLLLGRVEHAAHRLPAAREVDMHHRLRLAPAHRLRHDVPVETILLRPPVLVHVPLAHVVERVAAGAQQSREGGKFRRQAAAPGRPDVGVDHDAVVVRVHPGQQGGARRRAHRRGGVGVIEDGPLRRQTIQIRRPADRVAVAPEGVLPQLVGQEQDDVWSAHGPQCAQCRGQPPASPANCRPARPPRSVQDHGAAMSFGASALRRFGALHDLNARTVQAPSVPASTPSALAERRSASAA